MTRVTLGLSLTVDITALVTPQLSVEGKKTTLSYTRSMAQGGKFFPSLMPCREMFHFARPKTPRAGSWSDWGAWRVCSSGEECVYTRTRACDSPAPLFGGECQGEAVYKGEQDKETYVKEPAADAGTLVNLLMCL